VKAPLKSSQRMSPYRPLRKKSFSGMSVNVSSMSNIEGAHSRVRSRGRGSRLTRVLRGAPITLDSVTFSFSTDLTDPDFTDLKVVHEGTIGQWGAAFSIINVFMGMGLLSYPYALAHAGFSSLIPLAFATFAMLYTGKLIVRCFAGIPINEQTYHLIGYKALDRTFALKGKPLELGNWGQWFVTMGILVEFVGLICMQNIFIWRNTYILLPDVDHFYIAAVSTFSLLPTIWMLNVSELAFNAFLGCICKVFTVSVIVYTFFMNTEVVETTEYQVLPKSAPAFSVSMGIFILSYAGHACLPEIYIAMKEPKQFEGVMDKCFVLMFFIYSGFALFGYLQFGSDTRVIVTENLVADAEGSTLIVSKILAGAVAASSYFQISPLISVVATVPEDLCGIDDPRKQRFLRTVLFFGLVGLAWQAQERLEVVEAVTGSLSTMITSVVCPALFYYGLNVETVSSKQTVLLFTCMVAGVIIGIGLLYNDIVGVLNGEA